MSYDQLAAAVDRLGESNGELTEQSLRTQQTADAARVIAQDKATEATSAASTATNSKDSALASATSALASKNSAATSAATATSEATKAVNSAAAALASQTAAKTSETNAKASEVAAAPAIAAGLRFCGSVATAPTTRTNGTALQRADEYQNTVDNLRYSWSGTAWVALNSSAQQLEVALASSEGAKKSGYRAATVSDVLDGFAPFGPANQRIDQVSSTVMAGPFISRPWSTVAAMNIFVEPNTGNDINAGTQAAPLKTIDAAMQKVPQNIYHRVRIFLLDGDYSGQLIRAFNYYVSPRSSSTAGFKIIGHVAVVDGQAHPIYTDDANQNVIIGGGHYFWCKRDGRIYHCRRHH